MPPVTPRLEWRAGRVVATRQETPTVRTIVLDVPGWPGHRAGQHVDLRLTAEDGYQAQRSYSIASSPAIAQVELTVERLEDGEVSPYLTDVVRDGDRIEIRGPIGGYFVWEPRSDRPLALVAGGSGVVPLMAILRQRAMHGAEISAPAVLLYSARSADELIFHTEMDRLATGDGAIHVAYTLTRSQPADWTGYRRRIDDAMLRETLPAPTSRPLVYVCGPTPMVESAASLLVQLGFPPDDVRTERFGPTGGG